MKYLAERLGKQDYVRNFLIKHISNLLVLITGLLIGAFIKTLLF